MLQQYNHVWSLLFSQQLGEVVVDGAAFREIGS